MNKLIILCNYSVTPTCTGKCEKCRYLLSTKIIDLDKLPPTTTTENGCGCE